MSSTPEPERVDLCDVLVDGFGAIVQPSPAIPVGEIWMGPVEGDAVRAFGPGTTAGGRAEAGWFLAGRIVGEGPTFGDPRRKPGDLSAGPIPTTNGIQR